MLFFSKHKTVFSKAEKKHFTFLISFITLTLSSKQTHSDEEIKRVLLRPFLKWLERNGCPMYVWKAEAQANGNIHFHITVNNFIHWKSIRKKWNQLQSTLGYHKVFTKGRAEDGLNSTDVHSVINAKQTAAYMAKYISKNDKDRRQITGKVWGCSHSLCNISMIADEHESSKLESIDSFLEEHGKLFCKDEYSVVFTYEHLKFVKVKGAFADMLKKLTDERKKLLDVQKTLINVDTFF